MPDLQRGDIIKNKKQMNFITKVSTKRIPGFPSVIMFKIEYTNNLYSAKLRNFGEFLPPYFSIELLPSKAIEIYQSVRLRSMRLIPSEFYKKSVKFYPNFVLRNSIGHTLGSQNAYIKGL